jgi:hypothetical protein
VAARRSVGEAIQEQYGEPSPEMIDYIRRANSVSSS